MQILRLLSAIEELEANEIDEVLSAVMKRKRELYPDWELVYYARRKGSRDDMDLIRKYLKCNE